MRAALLAGLLLAPAAHAEPYALVVNMNYADGTFCYPEELAKGCVPKAGELASLEKVAASRGVKRRNLIVVPPAAAVAEMSRISAEKSRILSALRTLNPKLTTDLPAILQAIMDIGPPGLTDPTILAKLAKGGSTPAEQKAVQALQAVPLQRMHFDYSRLVGEEKQWGPIDQQMAAAMKQVHARGGKLELLSISGHSTGNEIFSETSYRLFPAQTRALVKTYPDLVKSPSRILLPGCYTYTHQEFERWQQELQARPDALIVGYDDPGFSRRQKAEWGYIEEVNDFANKLDAKTRSGQKVYTDQIRKGLYALEALHGYKGAAISYCSQYINSDPGGQEAMSCGDQWETLGEKSNDIEARYLAYDRVPEEDPPTGTASSPLRSFYSSWKRICSPKAMYPDAADAELAQSMSEERDEYSNRALRTIFWGTVETNFIRCRSAQVSALKTELDKAGLGQDLNLGGNSGRRDFIRAILNLKKKLKEAPDSQYSSVRQALDGIEPLVELNTQIPVSWVEAGTSCN